MRESNSGLLDQVPFPLPRIDAVFVAFAAVVVTAVALQGRQLLTVAVGPIVIGPVPALIAVAGVLLGPTAVVGCTIGYIGYYALQGLAPLWPVTGYLALGLLISLFWDALGTADCRTRPHLDSLSQLWTFASAAVLASLAAATLVTWGYDITGQFPFFPTVLFLGLGQALSVVIGAGVILTVIPRLLGTRRWQSLTDSLGARRPSLGSERASWVGLSSVLLCAWIGIGSALSIGFQVVELVPPFHIRLRDLDPLLLLKSPGLLSDSGASLQLGVGVTVLTLWLFSLRRWDIVAGLRESGGADD